LVFEIRHDISQRRFSCVFVCKGGVIPPHIDAIRKRNGVR
jgi:hypothetical protein